MRSTELRKIMESLHLPVSWLAKTVGVNENLAKDWVTGGSRVPFTVILMVKAVNFKINKYINSRVSIEQAYKRMHENIYKHEHPFKVGLLSYNTNDYLDRHEPDIGLPALNRPGIVGDSFF